MGINSHAEPNLFIGRGNRLSGWTWMARHEWASANLGRALPHTKATLLICT